MEKELIKGPVMRTMIGFAIPMILGDLLQQCYNIADTVIVGQYLGENALAAVGSAFSLMTFLTSILLGLAMGSGTVFSIRFGQKDDHGLKEGILASFVLLGIVTIVLNILIYSVVQLVIPLILLLKKCILLLIKKDVQLPYVLKEQLEWLEHMWNIKCMLILIK